jgi:hypothetical protein
MSLKTAKCERTGQQILLVDGFLVANAATGEWSFISIDAEEHSYDYHVAISALIKSPEALVDWMAHLHEKSWFKPTKLFEFFERFREENSLFGSL